MVPPSALTFANIINPYIEVTKTPVPPGPFENSELPLTVEYKITIKAKKDVLKNIRLTYECGVVKTGPKINCPPTSPNIPTTLEDIQPGETFSFSYKQEYSKGTFEDSLITNPREREKIFGQDDHVRKFGLDYPARIERAGLKAEASSFASMLPDSTSLRFGLQKSEILYLGHK